MTNPILYSQQRTVGTLTFNRPQARNALNWEAQQQFAQIINQLADNPPRILILTGTGDKAFVAGGDLDQLAADPSKTTGLKLHQTMTAALQKMIQLPCPVIAAVNGHTAGGGLEILSACDLRLAAPTAIFHFAHIRMGLTTGWGGITRLHHLLGKSKLAEMMLTGASIDVETAREIGLIHRIGREDQTLLDQAIIWAESISKLPVKPLSATKALLEIAANNPVDIVLQTEQAIFLDLFGDAPNREALNAFKEKRKPNFNQQDGDG